MEDEYKELRNNYIPIDFDAYSIEDKETILNPHAPLQDEDKIWRISNLTVFLDLETKILLMPLPESKRAVKIKDTKYSLNKVEDLLAVKKSIEKSLEITEEVVVQKRFEDMTQEELEEDMSRKRAKRMH